MKDKKLLLIFVKNLLPGNVKTRLAETVGDAKARQTYRKLVDFTIGTAKEIHVKKQIWYSSFVDKDDGYTGADFEKKLQDGDDLGQRMWTAFRDGFEKGFKKIIIIGSDCPDITPEIIENGFAGLNHKDVVIGPSEDGGYYLIGSTKFIPEIFSTVPWSTEEVFSETVRILNEKNLVYFLLPTLNDIDTEEDLRKSGFDE